MGAAINTCQLGGSEEELIFDRTNAFRSVGCQAPTESLLNANASSSSRGGGGATLTLDSRTSIEESRQGSRTPLALLDGRASTASLAEEERETIGADSVWQSVEAMPRQEAASPTNEDLAALEARLEARLRELKAVPEDDKRCEHQANQTAAVTQDLHPSIPEEQLLLGFDAEEEETAAGQPACWTPTLAPSQAVPVNSGASAVMPPQLRQKLDEGVLQQQPPPPQPRVVPARQQRQLELPALQAVQQALPQGPPMTAFDAKLKIKEWQMQLRLEAKQMDREIRRVKAEEARMQKTMRSEADKGNTHGVQQLARSIVRSRRAVLQLEKAKVQLNDMNLQLTSCSATLSVQNAMRLSVDAVRGTSGGGIQDLGAIVEQFQQENSHRIGVDELIDEAFRNDEDDEAAAAEAQRVLEELELDKIRLLASTGAPRQNLATSAVGASGSVGSVASAAGGGRQQLTTARHGGS